MATCQGWWRRVCLAGLPPGSLPLQISCLFPHHPPLYRKLACSQPVNMPINPLFEQYDLLRIGLPGVANAEKGVGGFAVIHISLDLCLQLDIFSLPPSLPLSLSLCLSYSPPSSSGRQIMTLPNCSGCHCEKRDSHLWVNSLSAWNTGFGEQWSWGSSFPC